MNLTITGHHLEVTPAIRSYVVSKMDRVKRHFDHVIDINVIMTVEKLKHIVEANVHLRGKDIFVQAEDADMYAAIDGLTDKLDRQMVKHKEKHGDVHQAQGAVKHQAADIADSAE